MAGEGGRRFLDPKTLTKISRLDIRARLVVEGFVTGLHRSPYHGFSVEFAEHRQYVPGDDLRDLDWRVFGKSDRYYIKQYIEETNMRVTLLVDASGSMRYTGDEASRLNGHALSKFDYARHLAASLAYLFIRQQDAVGLVTFDDVIRQYLRPAAKPSQVRMILDDLLKTEPGNDTRCAATFHEIAERIPSRGLVVIISDLFDNAEAIKNALHHFRYKFHEVLIFHLMAEEELTFPFKKFDHFKCLEIDNLRLNIDPQTIRIQYLERVKAHLKALELACGQMEADYVPVNTKTPVTETLLTYFSQRKAGQR